MNSTLNDDLDKVLAGKKKSMFQRVFLFYTLALQLPNKPANTPPHIYITATTQVMVLIFF